MKAVFAIFGCLFSIFSPVPSIIAPSVLEKLDGGRDWTWRSMPVSQPGAAVGSDLRAELEEYKLDPELLSQYPAYKDLSFGTAKAKDAVRIMYEGTKVSGVIEKIPEKLRGVYWMSGNGVPEELTVLQYGLWFEEEEQLIWPMAPFSWAWPDGKPKDAPFGGALYTKSLTEFSLRTLVLEGEGAQYSLAFRRCPLFGACFWASLWGDLTFADLQVHPKGDLTVVGPNAGESLPDVGLSERQREILSTLTGKFTLEDKGRGRWKRGIWWGLGNCRFWPFGGYTLLRLVDADGNPVEPYYSQFLEYMGDVPLIVWAGENAASSRELPRTQAARSLNSSR